MLVRYSLAGMVVWRRDLRLWLYAFTGTRPWRSPKAANWLFGLLPVLENIVPSRFDIVVYLCSAVMLGIVVDHTYSSANHWYRATAVESPARRLRLLGRRSGLVHELLMAGGSRRLAGPVRWAA